MNKDWLDIAMLEDYLDGKLTSRDMHFVERAVLEDPFVAEALEGLSKSPRRTNNLSLLQKQLQERTAQNEQKKRVWGLTWQRLSIAATAAVLFTSAGIIFWMKEDNRQRMLASQGKKVDVIIDQSSPSTAADKPAVVQREVAKPAPSAPEATTDLLAANKRPRQAGAVQPAVKANRAEVAAQPVAASQAAVSSAAVAAQPPQAFAASRNAGAAAVIAGTVVSEEGLPVAGARVSIPGSDKYATTDLKGNFKLPAFKPEQIAATSVGYAMTNLVASPQMPVRITLKQERASLADVVVLGSGDAQQRNLGNTGVLKDTSAAVRRQLAARAPEADARPRAKAKTAISTPVGGWEAYNQYLKDNSRLAGEKAANKLVSIGFRVGPDGRATDLKVLLGDAEADQTYLTELRRLITSGPLWHVVAGAETSGKVTMVF